ncbi:MAG: hypothetical protein ACYC4U_30520 [Pirellulaceae bacterium]
MTATPYDVLVESASRLFAADTLDEFAEHNISDAASLVEQNRLVLESARLLLSEQCCVPVRYERSFFPDHADDFSHLRNLARAFRMEALLSASHEEFGTAALVGVDILELANAVRRGGLVVDLLVSIAISGVAMDLLRKLRGNLDEATRLTLREALRSLEHEQEPFAAIYARDQAWERAVGAENEPCIFTEHELMEPGECGLSEDEQRVVFALMQQMAELPESEQREMQYNQHRHSLALMRMLGVDLALRSWHAQTHSYPASLGLLVPQHLPQVPEDPFTGDAFVYRPVDSRTFLLYSTGPTMADHGGVFGPWYGVAAGLADLCLDENDYYDSWQNRCACAEQRGFVSRILHTLHSWWRKWRYWLTTQRTFRRRMSR